MRIGLVLQPFSEQSLQLAAQLGATDVVAGMPASDFDELVRLKSRVEDAGRVGSRIFLVGERGVQVLGPKLDRVVDVVDVVPGREIAVFGRHLVTVGGSSLQVIDGLPFGPGPSLAAPAKAMVTAN